MEIRVRRGGGCALIGGSVMLLALGLLGLWTLWHGVRSAAYRIAAQSWDPAECVIEASEVIDTGASPRYELAVRYSYEIGGRDLSGQTWRWGSSGSDRYSEIQRLVARYPPGARVACWVSPEDPLDAALEKPSLWGLLELLIPLGMIGIPVGVFFLWRRLGGSTEPAAPAIGAGEKSISQRGKGEARPGCMAAFFSVFLLAGLGFFLFFAVPAWRVVQARSWVAVPCEILSSHVASHPGDDSTTYSVEVSYRYEVDGVEHRGDRYEFLGGSSSGYQGKRQIVDGLPAGSTTTCYYDPDDPFESVLHRGLTWTYLIALFPLVFVAVGGGGMFWALTSGRAKAAAVRAGKGAVAAGAATFREVDEWSTPVASTGTVDLEEKWSPFGKLAGITAIALFWNGIVSVFVWQLVEQWRNGGGLDGCLTLFLVPFVIIGLLLLSGVPYQALAMFNPRPKLRLSRAAIALGDSAQLDWSFRGSAGRLESLRIWVEGAETISYRQGTSTRTDSEIFARIDVVDRRAGMPMGSGSATVEIPEDTMHSFEAPHNKIVWTLKLHGSIARWPDVTTEFPLVVSPSRGRE